MAASSRLMITEAERRFPARIRIGVPPEGLGRQLTDMTAWLDANCGAGNWAMTPAGLRGVVNDALAIYFLDTALANAFVARWCLGYRVETYDGSFRLREDAPPPRVPAQPHGTPGRGSS
jgi:hypothetical protein